MNPLTIKEIKELKAGDEVYITYKNGVENYVKNNYARIDELTDKCILIESADRRIYSLGFSHYGISWIVWRSKEQAEDKSKNIELPCNVGDIVYINDKIFDYTDRRYKEGILSYQVVSISFFINKKNEQKSSIRLQLVVDGKTHAASKNLSFEEFQKICRNNNK